MSPLNNRVLCGVFTASPPNHLADWELWLTAVLHLERMLHFPLLAMEKEQNSKIDI
jgi:hypothetical protein